MKRATLLLIDEVPEKLTFLLKALNEAGYAIVVLDTEPPSAVACANPQFPALLAQERPACEDRPELPGEKCDLPPSNQTQSSGSHPLNDGVLLVTLDGEIEMGTHTAWSLLERFFPALHGGELPEALREWVLNETTPMLTLSIEGASLVLQCQRSEGGTELHLVRLEAQSAVPCLSALRELGLTPRETEVLFWLALGKTGPEIGIILGLAHNTVRKHVQHIYEKLGVENRTSAALRAYELIGMGELAE